MDGRSGITAEIEQKILLNKMNNISCYKWDKLIYNKFRIWFRNYCNSLKGWDALLIKLKLKNVFQQMEGEISFKEGIWISMGNSGKLK